jgi:hypothetical protein
MQGVQINREEIIAERERSGRGLEEVKRTMIALEINRMVEEIGDIADVKQVLREMCKSHLNRI